MANINKLYVISLIFVSQKQNSPQNPKTRELHKIQIQYNRTKNYNIINKIRLNYENSYYTVGT